MTRRTFFLIWTAGVAALSAAAGVLVSGLVAGRAPAAGAVVTPALVQRSAISAATPSSTGGVATQQPEPPSPEPGAVGVAVPVEGR